MAAATGKKGTAWTHDPVFVGGMIVMLLLLPIEQIIGPFSLRPVDGVIMLLTLWGMGKIWRAEHRAHVPLAIPMWLILCSSLIATTLGDFRQEGIVAIAQEAYLYAWFVVAANRLSGLSLKSRRLLMTIWVGVAAIESVLTLMGMFHIGPIFLYTPPHRQTYDYGGISRAVGTYVNSNAAGSFISTSFFVMISLPLPIWLRVVLGVWYFVGMYATGSNGAMLATAAALVTLAGVYSLRRQRRLALLGAAAAGIIGGLAAILPSAGLSIQAILRPGMGGALFYTSLGRIYWGMQRRLAILSMGWHEFVKRPWGVGPNAFGSLRASLHNDYIAFLFERGPVGFLGWLGIVGGTLATTLRESHRVSSNPARLWGILALGAGFLANALNSFVHEVSHFRSLWLLMIFLFAEIIAISGSQAANETASETNRSREEM